MILINQLQLMWAQPRVAQPHLWTPFMCIAEPLSLTSVGSLMRTVFATGTPTVMEQYYAYEAAPVALSQPADVVMYAEAEALRRGGAVSIAVHYPDMKGRLAVSRISLNPEKCRGATYRFSCEGLGVIYAYLPVAVPVSIAPFASANSEKRATAWASTYPDLDPPQMWDWAAVGRHLPRLRRALREVV
jgi:hypothetical protein